LSALWSIAGSIASIVLAVVAIFLAVYFYTQSKKSEKEVSNSLSKIETQAEALSKITGRQLDRLTKHATERRPQEGLPDLDAFVYLATSITQSLSATQPANNSHLQLENLRMTIGALYYSAASNFFAYMSLPAVSDYDENNQFHATTKRMMDLTQADVVYLDNILNDIAPDQIEQTGLAHLYREYHELWQPRVRDSTAGFASIEKLRNEG
jgi:hypothetical protein